MQWVFDVDPCWTATSRPEAFRTPVWAGGTWNSDHKVTIEVILQYCQEKCGGLHTKSNYAFPGMWFLSNCPFCAGSISVCNCCAIFNGMVGLDVSAKLLMNIGFTILLPSTTITYLQHCIKQAPLFFLDWSCNHLYQFFFLQSIGFFISAKIAF